MKAVMFGLDFLQKHFVCNVYKMVFFDTQSNQKEIAFTNTMDKTRPSLGEGTDRGKPEQLQQ